jgi:type III restriction enzyme
LKPITISQSSISPYFAPTRHHALGDDGRPLEHAPILGRRKSRYIVPVPKNRRGRGESLQTELGFEGDKASSGYSDNAIVNEIRSYLEAWRSLPDPHDWGVTRATQRQVSI